jgi:hypothetical protein
VRFVWVRCRVAAPFFPAAFRVVLAFRLPVPLAIVNHLPAESSPASPGPDILCPEGKSAKPA